MVDELDEGHHGDVFEVLAKAPRCDVAVDPLGVLVAEALRLEKLRVSLQDFGQVLVVSLVVPPQLLRLLDELFVLQQLQLLVLPEDDVVDFARQIFQEQVPGRVFSLLVFIEQVGPEDVVLPGVVVIGKEPRIFFKDLLNVAEEANSRVEQALLRDLDEDLIAQDFLRGHQAGIGEPVLRLELGYLDLLELQALFLQVLDVLLQLRPGLDGLGFGIRLADSFLAPEQLSNTVLRFTEFVHVSAKTSGN